MLSESASCDRVPGLMVSESPLMPAKASCGNPHSGPCTRGKSTNSTSAAGAACASSRPVVRRLARSARCGALKPTSVAVMLKTPTHMAAAVGIDCV